MTIWYPRSAIICAGVLCGLLYGRSLVGHAACSDGAVSGVPALGALGKLALSAHPSALLGGRLSVRMPAVAEAHPRGHDIMAAPASDEEESRIVVDAGKERVVLMAYELYALSGSDLEEAARADVAGSWGKEAAAVKLEKLTVAPPLTAVTLVPPRQDGQRDANLVLGLFVGNGDGTVQYLAFYVNPAGARDATGAATLCRKIAATVRAGSRRLSWKSGPRSFPGIGNDRLVIMAPEGFVASIQEGPDFSIYWLRKISTLVSRRRLAASTLALTPPTSSARPKLLRTS
jgi:hypothetical protein